MLSAHNPYSPPQPRQEEPGPLHSGAGGRTGALTIRLARWLASCWTVLWAITFALLAIASWAGIADRDVIVTTWESWFVATIIALMLCGVLLAIAGIASAVEWLQKRRQRASRGSGQLRSQ